MDQDGSSPEQRGNAMKSSFEGTEFTFTSHIDARSRGSRGGSPASLFGDSESLTDSVVNFPERFGRSYHAYRAGSYPFPNDLLEQERLALQHAAFVKVADGKLFFAPFSSTNPPRFVLDIATGTGEWAIAMGDLFPTAQITATDLSPIQPAEVPLNVNFFVEDSSDPWEFSHKFDYIHIRNTGACWADFETQIARQAFDALLPNGWFEVQELDGEIASDDGTLDPDGALMRWCRDIMTASAACQRPLDWMPRLRDILGRVGFVDVHERILRIPLNGWPRDQRLREVGQMWERNIQAGLAGFSFSFFNSVFDRSREEIEIDLMAVRRELSDPSVHAYIRYGVFWARKPDR